METFLAWTEHFDTMADHVCMIVSIEWRTPATILPVFYKQMLIKMQVLSQEGVLKVKCYTYHGNCVFHIMVTTISIAFLLFHPV